MMPRQDSHNDRGRPEPLGAMPSCFRGCADPLGDVLGCVRRIRPSARRRPARSAVADGGCRPERGTESVGVGRHRRVRGVGRPRRVVRRLRCGRTRRRRGTGSFPTRRGIRLPMPGRARNSLPRISSIGAKRITPTITGSTGIGRVLRALTGIGAMPTRTPSCPTAAHPASPPKPSTAPAASTSTTPPPGNPRRTNGRTH